MVDAPPPAPRTWRRFAPSPLLVVSVLLWAAMAFLIARDLRLEARVAVLERVVVVTWTDQEHRQAQLDGREPIPGLELQDPTKPRVK